MELKFDPKCKWSVFRAKYLKSEIGLKTITCCVFAVFLPLFRASHWRPFWAIFCLTVDATSVKVKPVRDKTSLRPLNRISPQTASSSSEKR